MSRIDPRLKKLIKEAIEGFVYTATKRRFDTKLREIITTNSVDSRFTHHSFSYRGEYYSFEVEVPRFKTQRLLPELHPSMDAWLAAKKELEYFEVPYVAGFFNKVLNASNSVLDYRAILPDWLHPTLDAMNIPEALILPREMTDEQVEQFKETNAAGLLMLKKRMVLDLVTV